MKGPGFGGGPKGWGQWAKLGERNEIDQTFVNGGWAGQPEREKNKFQDRYGNSGQKGGGGLSRKKKGNIEGMKEKGTRGGFYYRK